MAEDAAAEVRLEFALHERRHPRALGIPGRLGEEGIEVGLDGPVEQPSAAELTHAGARVGHRCLELREE